MPIKINVNPTKFGLMIAVFLVFSVLLLAFSQMNNYSENMTANTIDVVTSNNTAFVASDGTVPRYNGFFRFIGDNILWEIFGGFALMLFIAASKIGEGD